MNFRSTPIVGDRKTKLTKWLIAPEASLLLSAMEFEADVLEAEAVAVKMREPVAVIQGDADVEKVHDLFRQAAILRLAATVFREKQSQKDFNIHHVRPTADPADSTGQE